VAHVIAPRAEEVKAEEVVEGAEAAEPEVIRKGKGEEEGEEGKEGKEGAAKAEKSERKPEKKSEKK